MRGTALALASLLLLVPASTQAQDNFELQGKWNGTFDCDGNSFVFALNVPPHNHENEQRYRAKVTYHTHPETEIVTYGTTQIQDLIFGAYNVEGWRGEITRNGPNGFNFNPRDWVNQPAAAEGKRPGFIQYEFDGQVSSDGQSISGTVEGWWHQRCGQFNGTRVAEDFELTEAQAREERVAFQLQRAVDEAVQREAALNESERVAELGPEASAVYEKINAYIAEARDHVDDWKNNLGRTLQNPQNKQALQYAYGYSQWVGCLPTEPCYTGRSLIDSMALYNINKGYNMRPINYGMLLIDERNIPMEFVEFVNGDDYSTDIPINGIGDTTGRLQNVEGPTFLEMFVDRNLQLNQQRPVISLKKYGAVAHCGPTGCYDKHFLSTTFQDMRRQTHYGNVVYCLSEGNEAIWSLPVSAILPIEAGQYPFESPERNTVEALYVNYETEAPCMDTGILETTNKMINIIKELEEFATDAVDERIGLLRSEGGFE